MPRNFFALSVAAGMLCTLFVFYFMSLLIMNNKGVLQDQGDNVPINFLRVYKEDNLETRNRLPSKPPSPEKRPEQPQLKISIPTKLSKPQLNWNTPNISQSLNFKSGALFSKNSPLAGSAEVLPLVRVEPQYPQRARISGTEGWVEVGFDVSATGSVINVHILASQPWKVFDSSARRAVQRWKYKPRVINGKPTIQKNLNTRFEFKLEETK